MIKNILLFFVFLFIGVGLLIWVIDFIGWQEITSAFLIFAGWHGLIILLLTLVILLLGMWKWQVILKSQGYDLSAKKLAGPYFAGISLTYLFPLAFFGAEIFKGHVLKDKFSIPWKNSITSIIIDRILELTSILIVVLAAITLFFFEIGFPPQKLGIIFGIFIFLASVGIGFFYLKVFRKESLAKVFARVFGYRKFINNDVLEAEKEIFVFFKHRKSALVKASLLAFLKIVAGWLRCWLLLLFLGKSVGALTAVSILGFYYLVFLIPIPASLGSHELIQTFAFAALGVGAGAAPAFAMIQRGAELILVFIGLIFFFKLGINLIKNILSEKIENLLIDNKQ